MLETIRYKLTDKYGYTHGHTQWQEGASYTTSGQGELCGPGWLHCYSDPVLAIFMNPHHANFTEPKLCEVICSGQSKLDHGLKEGWTTMSFKQWLPVPAISTTQRIAFGILCAKEVTTDQTWLAWAGNWLSGKDRTKQAADADAAAHAAYAVHAAVHAAAAAYAADAADAAAAYAAHAAAYAADAGAQIDLVAIAHKALEYK